MTDNSIAALILESVRPELSKMIEEAVLSALSTFQGRHRYPEMVGVVRAAEITGYSRNSIYQMHSQGKIPCAIKVGSRLMFRTAELREWVDNGGPNHADAHSCRRQGGNPRQPVLSPGARKKLTAHDRGWSSEPRDNQLSSEGQS